MHPPPHTLTKKPQCRSYKCNSKNVLIIPRTIERLLNLIFILFFDCKSCMKLFIFRPKTGSTHGMKFNINHQYKKNKIKNKLKFKLFFSII